MPPILQHFCCACFCMSRCACKEGPQSRGQGDIIYIYIYIYIYTHTHIRLDRCIMAHLVRLCPAIHTRTRAEASRSRRGGWGAPSIRRKSEKTSCPRGASASHGTQVTRSFMQQVCCMFNLLGHLFCFIRISGLWMITDFLSAPNLHVFFTIILPYMATNLVFVLCHQFQFLVLTFIFFHRGIFHSFLICISLFSSLILLIFTSSLYAYIWNLCMLISLCHPCPARSS